MFIFGRYLSKPDMPFVRRDLLSANFCTVGRNKYILFTLNLRKNKQI